MNIEQIVVENTKQIASNTAHIGVLMKFGYAVMIAVITQVAISVRGLFNGKKKNDSRR
jgi:hypothetical protein